MRAILESFLFLLKHFWKVFFRTIFLLLLFFFFISLLSFVVLYWKCKYLGWAKYINHIRNITHAWLNGWILFFSFIRISVGRIRHLCGWAFDGMRCICIGKKCPSLGKNRTLLLWKVDIHLLYTIYLTGNEGAKNNLKAFTSGFYLVHLQLISVVFIACVHMPKVCMHMFAIKSIKYRIGIFNFNQIVINGTADSYGSKSMHGRRFEFRNDSKQKYSYIVAEYTYYIFTYIMSI